MPLMRFDFPVLTTSTVRRGWLVPAGLWLALATPMAPLSGQSATAARPAGSAEQTVQPSAAAPMSQDVYDVWVSIASPRLSNDGQWVAYTRTPTIGDGDLVLRATGGNAEFTFPRGFTGRPQDRAGVSGGGFNPAAPAFSADNRFAFALMYPSQALVDSTRRDRRRAAEASRTSLAIVALPGGTMTTVPRVRSFTTAREGGQYLVYQMEADSSARGGANGAAGRGGAGAAGAAGAPAAGGRPAAPAARAGSDSARRSAPRRETGSTLVLRTLATGSEVRIDDVVNFALDDNEGWLAYTVGEADSTKTGLYLRHLASGTVHTLQSGRGTVRNLTFDRDGTQLAFAAAPPAATPDSSADASAIEPPRYAVYHVALVTRRNAAPVAQVVVRHEDAGEGMVIPERGRLDFTRDGSALLFAVAPAPLDSIPADSLANKAIYDLWHWQDPQLQPTQARRANQDRSRSFTAIYHPRLRRIVRLADDTLASVQVSDDGRVAVASTNVPYQVAQMWGEGGTDIWVIDATTGARTRVAERVERGGQLSPGGKFVLWFADDQWHAYDIAARTVRTLTSESMGVRFSQETWSTPSTPAPWGVSGWTTNDARVLLNDRYDVWSVDPRGAAAPQRVTGGVGRANQHVFRVVNLDPEERALDPSQPLLLSAFDDVTKESGWWRVNVADGTPTKIRMEPKRFSGLTKARNAERYLVAQSDYREFPDLWAGTDLTALTKISNAMPDHDAYPRGNVQLVSWLSADGDSLAGLLYTPDDFDATKRYPMVVYFYETHSENLHGYVRPAGRNIVNPVVYTSHGYLVFMPDIRYTDGYPGPSAVKSVVPGVQSLIQRGFVDKDAIGIGGQSWGGYQTAYIVTQTQLFKAAVPNATVVNMTSAYGGIRWGTGVSRSFQYEKGQSRIGGSLWEYPERFIENSPLFFADRITTPLLFMANDNDGAVPWYQGIEFFVALRRLGKEAYMVNYNGDEHNPTKRANQLDIDRKQLEFFGHHLKGDPAPEWMTRGIPYLEKGRDQWRPAAPAPRAAASVTNDPGTP